MIIHIDFSNILYNKIIIHIDFLKSSSPFILGKEFISYEIYSIWSVNLFLSIKFERLYFLFVILLIVNDN